VVVELVWSGLVWSGLVGAVVVVVGDGSTLPSMIAAP
jgi:hypothetical protein